ncbi:hypothetical protein FB446DRAFT_770780 [Lentinula raphanica]|nr:hypothetical protein FB446DRAFT_770780 [Lentinula raphanica]
MRFLGLHHLKPPHLSLLAGLPLWKSTQNEYSWELQRLWSALKDNRADLTLNVLYQKLSQMLQLPDLLPVDRISNYKYLLTKFVNHMPHQERNTITLLVPNGQLYLKPVHHFFNSQSEFFRAAFHYNHNEMFIHQEFRNLEDRLAIKRNITIDIFQQCAQAIHDDQLDGRTDEIIARATTIYTYYNHQLPSQIMSRISTWETISDICFIPHNNEPLEGFSFDASVYLANPVPFVVSPQQLLRNEYKDIAWTQRVRFLIPPTADLVAVYSKIGLPTAKDVVSHLVVLATQVSHDHPHDEGLVRSLKATYQWIQDNHTLARPELKKHQSQKIFLNIDNIDNFYEDWEWRSANELILDLVYDSQKCFSIRPFLAGYRDLLTAAGVRKQVDVILADETQFGDLNFERLRIGGKLLDIELCPSHVKEYETVDTSRLKAHAAFLAAHVPHIEEGLTGGWNEGVSGTFTFPGTFFGACTFLDILYTGDTKITRPPVVEDAMRLLTDLLEMLEVADIWDLPALKKRLAWLITSKYLFIQPETILIIKQAALDHNAPELIQACREFEEKNAEILPDLDDDDDADEDENEHMFSRFSLPYDFT